MYIDELKITFVICLLFIGKSPFESCGGNWVFRFLREESTINSYSPGG